MTSPMTQEQMTSPMTQEHFLAGLVHVIQTHPDDDTHNLKPKALKLLLFTGVLDDDLERVQFALDNGAHAGAELTPHDKTILTSLGWELPNLLSPGVSPECSDQSLSSEEAFPND